MKTEKEMLQLVFDRVGKHLLKQGRRSTMERMKNACAYRGDDGLQCAVGCLIDDVAYDYDIEGRPVSFSTVVKALRQSSLFTDELGFKAYDSMPPSLKYFLLELQNVHDNYDPAVWKLELFHLAHRFELSPSQLP